MKIIFIVPCILASAFYTYNYFFNTIDNEQIITQIMNYKMTHIIERCKKDFDYTDDDMCILEKELKRYFILSAIATKHVGTGMYSKDVDNLWHSFILFTKEYSDFCQTYVGKFIHHIPETDSPKTSEEYANVHKDFQEFIALYEAIFKEEVHSVWFLDMC